MTFFGYFLQNDYIPKKKAEGGCKSNEKAEEGCNTNEKSKER